METTDADLQSLEYLKIRLFYFESPDIKVTNVLYFNGDDLVFEGYDIGNRVEEAWGDSDYEYDFNVSGKEVEKFYPLLNVTPGDKKGLLLRLYERFAGNHAYSEMCDFMNEHGIDSSGFTWT